MQNWAFKNAAAFSVIKHLLVSAQITTVGYPATRQLLLLTQHCQNHTSSYHLYLYLKNGCRICILMKMVTKIWDFSSTSVRKQMSPQSSLAAQSKATAKVEEGRKVACFSLPTFKLEASSPYLPNYNRSPPVLAVTSSIQCTKHRQQNQNKQEELHQTKNCCTTKEIKIVSNYMYGRGQYPNYI